MGFIGRPINPISPIPEEMMTFLDRINEDLKAAMKSKDSDRYTELIKRLGIRK